MPAADIVLCTAQKKTSFKTAYSHNKVVWELFILFDFFTGNIKYEEKIKIQSYKHKTIHHDGFREMICLRAQKR
jgi:hypothetical protein